MNRRRLFWFTAMLMLTLLAAVSAPAFPMTQDVPAPEEATGEETEQDDSAVERILQQQEEMLRGQQFSYDPGDRRDPFLSLFEPVRKNEPRPIGIAGMLVSEIDLAGIVQDSNGGNLAFFTGSDNKGYFLKIGESVFDATLIAIDAQRGSVTFRQQVDDPRQIKPYRDVVRRLATTDEESSNE
jgi:hypothetical protein